MLTVNMTSFIEFKICLVVYFSLIPSCWNARANQSVEMLNKLYFKKKKKNSHKVWLNPNRPFSISTNINIG